MEFTIPATANQFRFSYRVRLDKGWLAFNTLKLTGWSETIPVTGGEQYELSLLIGGEMPVPLGHGGRIRAHYPGSSADPVTLWVNPANFNNSGKNFSQVFTPPASTNSIQFRYQVTMDKGRLAFSEAALSHLNPGYTITRKTYALGGQTIATRISGDQEGENGLFYIHSDHLGSTSVMSDAGGNEVPDSTARYLPFGDWRVEPGHDLTDQGFTGQKHNMDLGLYYYNARFYLPGIGRFASADTLVPDPMNPQQFNRYTYVVNNPLRYSDPTGHVCYDHTAGPELLGTCIDENGTTYRLTRDPIPFVEWEIQLLTMIIINEIAGQPLEQIEVAVWTVLNRYTAADLRSLQGFESRIESILIGSPMQYHASFGYNAESGTYLGGVFSGGLAGTGPLGPEAISGRYTGWLTSHPYTTQDRIDIVSDVINAYNRGVADPTRGADSFYHVDSTVIPGAPGGAYHAELEMQAALANGSPQAAAATGSVEGHMLPWPQGWSKDMVYWKQWGR